MHFSEIILKMDPGLNKFMKSLKRQADGRKISTVAGIAPPPIDNGSRSFGKLRYEPRQRSESTD